MKLVYIYGPPASGKLTVAKEIARITKFKLFHNHLINDVVGEVMDFENKHFWEFTDKLKLLTFDLASKYKVKGMVFTQVFVKNADFPIKMKDVMEKHKGEVYFVKLEPDKNEILRRVSYPSRRKYRKLSSKTRLRDFIEKHDTYSKLPFRKQIVIDNSKTSAKKVANMVVKRFKLK